MKKIILSIILTHRQRFIIKTALEAYKVGSTQLGKDQLTAIQKLLNV